MRIERPSALQRRTRGENVSCNRCNSSSIGRVGVFADGKFLFVSVVARIHANLFNVLDGLHCRTREEMNVGNEGNVGRIPRPRTARECL